MKLVNQLVWEAIRVLYEEETRTAALALTSAARASNIHRNKI